MRIRVSWSQWFFVMLITAIALAFICLLLHASMIKSYTEYSTKTEWKQASGNATVICLLLMITCIATANALMKTPSNL